MAFGVVVVEEAPVVSASQPVRKTGELFVHNPYFLPPPPTNQDEASSSSQCDEPTPSTSAQTKLRKRGSRGGRRVQAQRAAQAARKQQQYNTSMQPTMAQPTPTPYTQMPMYGSPPAAYFPPYYGSYEPAACSPCCASSANHIAHYDDCEDNDCCSIGSSASFSYPRTRNDTRVMNIPQHPSCVATSSPDCCSTNPMQAPAHMATPCASSMFCVDMMEDEYGVEAANCLKHTVPAR